MKVIKTWSTMGTKVYTGEPLGKPNIPRNLNMQTHSDAVGDTLCNWMYKSNQKTVNGFCPMLFTEQFLDGLLLNMQN